MEQFNLEALLCKLCKIFNQEFANPAPSKIFIDDDCKKRLMSQFSKWMRIKRRNPAWLVIPKRRQHSIAFHIAHPDARRIFDLSQIIERKPLQYIGLQKPLDQKLMIALFGKASGNRHKKKCSTKTRV